MFQFGGGLFEIKHNNLPIFWPMLWGYEKTQKPFNRWPTLRKNIWSEKNIKQGCMHCAHMSRSTINPPNHRKFYLCQTNKIRTNKLELQVFPIFFSPFFSRSVSEICIYMCNVGNVRSRANTFTGFVEDLKTGKKITHNEHGRMRNIK